MIVALLAVSIPHLCGTAFDFIFCHQAEPAPGRRVSGMGCFILPPSRLLAIYRYSAAHALRSWRCFGRLREHGAREMGSRKRGIIYKHALKTAILPGRLLRRPLRRNLLTGSLVVVKPCLTFPGAACFW